MRFSAFSNCSKLQFFSTFWVLRNFYCGDVHHANYCEFCLNPHFFHCAHCVNKIYSVLEAFDIAVCFCIFLRLRNIYSGDAHHTNYGKHSLNHHFRHFANCMWDSQCFQTVRNNIWFCTFWLLRNFNFSDANHSNYCELCINHHFFHCAHWVNKIYSVFKLSNLQFVLHILAFTKFLVRWCVPC